MSSLFNEVNKKDFSPKKSRENNYSFLNRSSWEISSFIRSIIDKFVVEYKPDQNFFGDVRAKSDKQHNSAIFELLVYVLLKNSGLKLTRHPETRTGKRPDFNATIDHLSFFVECTLSAASFETIEETNRMNSVIEIIDSLEYFPYWINLDFNIISTESISKRKFLKFLEENKNNCDNYSDQKCIQTNFLYIEQGWEIEVSLFRKTNTEIKGSLGMTSSNVRPIDTVKPLLAAMSGKKGSRYGIEKEPYVIFINTDDMFARNTCFSTALFGQEGDEIDLANSYVEDSFFLINGEPINTTVSAVVFFKYFDIFSLDLSMISVWHNPFSINVLPFNILPFDEHYFTIERTVLKKQTVKKVKNVFELLEINKEEYIELKNRRHEEE